MIQPSPEILFRRPALVTGRMMLRLAWVLVLFGVRWYAPPASPLGLFGVRWFEPPANAIPYYLHAEIFILELALIVAGMVGWQFWLRRAGGPKPIRLGQEVITLPRGPDSLRTVMIAYSDVRSVTVMGHGWRKRLILDTTRGAFVYPVSRFMAPDAAEALRAGLRLRIEALADGAERWAAMEARHRLAESLSAASPWGTWSAAAVLVACFVAQRAIDGAELGFAGIDSGANSSFLVRNGEWFRLFSGNLLHASPQHLIGNCAMLLLLGIMLERLLGVANFLIVLLATAVMSLGVSALAGLAYGSNISSLGASGAIFGLLGRCVWSPCVTGATCRAAIGYRFGCGSC